MGNDLESRRYFILLQRAYDIHVRKRLYNSITYDLILFKLWFDEFIGAGPPKVLNGFCPSPSPLRFHLHHHVPHIPSLVPKISKPGQGRGGNVAEEEEGKGSQGLGYMMELET